MASQATYQGGGDENESLSDNEDELQSAKIIESLTSKYNEQEGSELLGKTIEYLRENIRPGICLICIEDIERTEAVWSCKSCHCMHHLVCIQRWAKDSMAMIREKAAQRGFNLPIIWCWVITYYDELYLIYFSPKCRRDYSEKEYPDQYRCFCEKVLNPKADPWVAPHSCGEVCNKPLQPECGHPCVLLCHSGSCPPCPKYVTVSCFCGKSTPQTKRCFLKNWACQSVCGQQQPCGVHACPEICHESECPPCKVPVTLYCRCSSPSPQVFPCHKVTEVDENGKPECVVSCGKQCKKILSCGIHKCDRVCHEDNCGVCQIACPCGKETVPCTGSQRGIGKPCSQKCHQGSCGLCLLTVVKKCRCGQVEKEVSCSKDLVCEFKCKKLKDCKLHACNRKCCIECSPCTSSCGKALSCKNHKCESACNHVGRCYPCPVTVQVKCRCGSTVRQVPCGFERKCKPPDCSKLCTRPPKCDHPKIQNHRCHFGDCPKCVLKCGKRMVCSHLCKKVCHNPKQKGGNGNNNQKNTTPCGPCHEIIRSECKLHANVEVKCFQRFEKCKELCMKPLSCGIHFCNKICHESTNPDGCGVCREACSKPRPAGCTHQCDLGCHEGPCSICTLVATVSCHCGQEEIFVPCFKQSSLSETEKSCKNQCVKKLSCHHRCLSLCHSGECPETEKCRRKVKLTCKCKHLKKDLECFLVNDITGEGKFLDCSPATCNIQKSPKETPSGTAKKRHRKKKTSEGEKDVAEAGSEESTLNKGESDTKVSGSSETVKKVVVICVAVVAVALLFAVPWK
ncbi:NF-X1-type zinc finger protein NFXL1 [Orchesella cincta]|uniref:NF-X1-type zinc finger protein NFXL1 n=1 Tax=Orchesella cincta TaxID=48709 RepID=A0A1D2M993_ORCCI|nr:NF-X1-type zinc finger protein NFXL1 [Orchesella cincta]